MAVQKHNQGSYGYSSLSTPVARRKLSGSIYIDHQIIQKRPVLLYFLHSLSLPFVSIAWMKQKHLQKLVSKSNSCDQIERESGPTRRREVWLWRTKQLGWASFSDSKLMLFCNFVVNAERNNNKHLRDKRVSLVRTLNRKLGWSPPGSHVDCGIDSFHGSFCSGRGGVFFGWEHSYFCFFWGRKRSKGCKWRHLCGSTPFGACREAYWEFGMVSRARFLK